jgi:hypothetical protein
MHSKITDTPILNEYHNNTLKEHRMFLKMLLADERGQHALRESYKKTQPNQKKRRANIKQKLKKRNRGKQRRCFEYDIAKTIVRAEGIMSGTQYRRWIQMNHPVRMPAFPERAYKSTWTGWGDFLGVYNTWTRRPGDTSNGKGKYRTFADAKKFARSLNFSTINDWKDYVRSGKCPMDIPHRPDIVYTTGKRVDYWLSWKDFLGYDVKNTAEKIAEVSPVLYIARRKGSTNASVYIINVIPGGKVALLDHISKLQLTVIRAFYTNIKFNNREFFASLSKYPYGEVDEYILPNIYDTLDALDDLDPVV